MPDVNTPETRPTGIHAAPGPAAAPGTTKHHRALWVVLPLLMVLAVSGGLFWWLNGRAHPQGAAVPPMKVPVLTVIASTVPIYRSFPATIQAMRSVPIQARVTGYLVEQGAVDGADVASGALLYRIDPKDHQAAFAQAQALLAQADAGLKYARASKGRNQTLARDGWASQDTSDQASSTFYQGQASLASNDALVQEAALERFPIVLSRAALAGFSKSSEWASFPATVRFGGRHGWGLFCRPARAGC